MFLINAVASFIIAFTSTVFLLLPIHFRFFATEAAGINSARSLGETPCGHCLSSFWHRCFLRLVEPALSGPVYSVDCSQFTVGWLARKIFARRTGALQTVPGDWYRSQSWQYRLFQICEFFVDNLTVVGGTDYHLATIILALAISFFTFQKNTFLIDAYRGLVLPP